MGLLTKSQPKKMIKIAFILLSLNFRGQISAANKISELNKIEAVLYPVITHQEEIFNSIKKTNISIKCKESLNNLFYSLQNHEKWSLKGI